MVSIIFQRFRKELVKREKTKIESASYRIFIAIRYMISSLSGKFLLGDTSVGRMRHLAFVKSLTSICLLLIIFTFSSFSQDTIWFEGFTGLADGTTSDAGPTAWSIDVSNCNFLVIINFSSSTDLEITSNGGKGRKIFCDLINKSTNWDDIFLFYTKTLS